MIWPAVRAVAAHEWSRRWRALLAVGLVAGLLGGLVVAAVGLTRRTATAPDRLFEAVAPGDVEVQVFGRPELIASISSRREVAAAWPAAMIVGQLEGPAVAYLGIVSGPPRPDGLLDPVVIDGREPDPAEPHEVALHEQAADDLGLGPGDHIGLHLLTAEEVGQFDVGFGVPDGPRVDLTVTGVIRVPNGVLGSAPLLGTPAFAARYGDNAAGTFVHAALRRGAADVDDYVAGVEDLAADVAPVEGAEEFGPVTALPLARGTVAARSSARVLVAGLTAAVVVSAVAGLFALGQAMARHQAVGAPDQVVEEALGMTRPERVAARLLPASVAALLAGAVAAGVALAGALVEPPGAVGAWEPRPGWLPDPWSIGPGVVAVVVALVVLAGITAAQAGSRSVEVAATQTVGGLRHLPWPTGWSLTGATFALSRGGRGRAVPVRSALVGTAIGVAGLVAGLVFGASLDRLASTPQRWGWSGDLLVVDATDETTALLLADPRVEAATTMRTAAVRIEGPGVDGVQVTATSEEPVRGDLRWTILTGRLGVADHEIVVGSRLAAELGLAVGDTVDLGDGPAEVVGLGVGPDANGDGLGMAVLVSSDRLASAGVRQQFRELLVSVAPGVRVEDFGAELAERYELQWREPPAEVRDLAELGRLPELLGAFLAVLGVLALTHALLLTARRRSGDLAVLQALGSTPTQAALAVVAMAFTSTVIGVLVGVPLGWATARLVWGEVATATGVAPDVVVPSDVGLVVIGALVVAALVSAVPALAARRLSPARQLRAE